MEFTAFELPNGIRCIHRQVKSAVSYCGLIVNTGSRDEQPSEYGMAHFIEHSIFKGTKKRKAFHINNRLENLGGELNAYTTKEETVVHATTLKSDFPKAAELIADIVFNSTFPQKEIDKEKEIIVDEINSYKDTPSERIYDDYEDLLFKGSALGHNILGYKRNLMKFRTEDILKFQQRTYNTDKMVFASIGHTSERQFREVCERYFAPVPENRRQFERTTVPPAEIFCDTLHRSTFQAHCILGNRAYNSSDKRRIPLSLLINMLGGASANSILNTAIREKNGFSYNIEANYTPFSDTGLATIYFGTDKDKIEKCIELIQIELQKIISGQLTNRQLSIAKKQFTGQLYIGTESNEGNMLSAAKSYLIYNHVDSMADIAKRIDEIKKEEITEVAGEVFGSQLSTLIYK